MTSLSAINLHHEVYLTRQHSIGDSTCVNTTPLKRKPYKHHQMYLIDSNDVNLIKQAMDNKIY